MYLTVGKKSTVHYICRAQPARGCFVFTPAQTIDFHHTFLRPFTHSLPLAYTYIAHDKPSVPILIFSLLVINGYTFKHAVYKYLQFFFLFKFWIELGKGEGVP